MKRRKQWSDPKVWIPLLSAIIASIIGPITVLSYQGFFNNSSDDKIGPIVHVPQTPVKAEANTSSGSSVTYSVYATDDVDGTITASCEPTSGSFFHIGITQVTCIARDSSGNTDSQTFTVTVQDTRAPAISVPTVPLKFKTISQSGVSVNYADEVTVKDGIEGTITAQCTPLSGSTFPVGNTEVTCTATDKAGNRAEEKRFTISVLSLVPLKLYYSDSRQDNFLVATDQEDLSYKYPEYTFVRTEGYIYRNQQADDNLVPLKLYYSDSRQDNFLVATDIADPFAKDTGYFFVRTEGYIYRNQQADDNLVPLKLYYSDSRQEFFTVATEEGVSDAERAGYRLIGTEGFVYSADAFPDL